MTEPTVGTTARTLENPTADPTRASWLIPVGSFLWLAAKLWSSHRQIHTSGGGSIAVATAALALPGVVQATMVAGLGAGLLAMSLVRGGFATRRIAAPVGGLLVGLVALGLVLGAYGHLTSMLSVAVSIAVAGLIGGVVVTIRPAPGVLGAGLAAALGAFLVATVLNSHAILSRLLTMFGAGNTFSSQLHASNVVAFVYSLVGGLVAGAVAFWYLRRETPDRQPVRRDMTGYLIAGGLTGLVLLASEAVTRIGGAHLVNTVRAISPDDRALLDLLASARVINAMVVLFAGAFVSLVAFGRTIKPSRAPIPASAPVPESPSAE